MFLEKLKSELPDKITSKRGLAENILSPHSLKNNSFSNIFNGSGERISQFLMGTNE